MKKITLINSHCYSGSSVLYDAMCECSNIQGYKSKDLDNNYFSNISLLNLTKKDHKKRNRSALYLDEILYNYSLSTKLDFSNCFFIIVIKRPEGVLRRMILNNKLKPTFAVRHYTYRLRRLCEMTKCCSNYVLLTFEDLKNNIGTEYISNYLKLKETITLEKESLDFLDKELDVKSLKYEHIKEAESSYERYFYFLKQQKNLVNF